ncbi:MAG: PAS domain-containing protein [Rariglobus sp.]
MSALDDDQRRQIEAQLRDATTRLETILGTAEIATWTWDLVKDRVFADKNLDRFFSVSAGPEGIPVKEFFKSIHPDDLPAMLEILERSMASKHVRFESDYRVVQPDGTARWLNARGGFQRDQNGRPVFMSGVLIDITDRKKAEAERDALLESERAARRQADELNARLNFSLSSLELGDWMWDVATDLISISPRTAEIYGVPADTGMTREAMRSVLHEDDRDLARTAARQAVANHTDYAIEYRVNHSTRGLRWVAARGRPVFDAHGVITGMMGVVQDITEQRAQEQSVNDLSSKLRAQTEHFETTLSNLNDFVYSFDREGRVTYANRSLLALWQQTPTSVIGKSFHELGYPDDLATRHLSEIAQVIATRKPYIGETPYLRPDGSWVFFQYIFSPVFDEKGEVIAIAGTTRDTTQRKETEIALAAAREELQNHARTLEATVAERTARLQETIGELEAFSYSVSHDMRAPLRAMQGYADALIQDYAPQLDEDAQRHLTRIRKNSERLELLVRDILTYSRVAKEDIKLTAIPLQAFLENLLPQLPNLQPPLAHVHYPLPLPTLLAHEAYLSQIFSNLLGNAIKFVAPGTIPVIDISIEDEGDFVKIRIKDNGLGIAPEHFSRIFNIFGRVYPDKKFEGTGIGLSIVKKAVQRMGGVVGVESKLGEGSCFWFTVRKS